MQRRLFYLSISFSIILLVLAMQFPLWKKELISGSIAVIVLSFAIYFIRPRGKR
ncbi:MAG: hypothetical protein JNL72_07660 [Flavipsychrobacter sp.]|nr:hypothetical protein [Flavipsychrobacter sp.]